MSNVYLNSENLCTRFRENSLLFATNKNCFFFDGIRTAIKYNREVTDFELLSFFHCSTCVVESCHLVIFKWKKQCRSSTFIQQFLHSVKLVKEVKEDSINEHLNDKSVSRLLHVKLGLHLQTWEFNKWWWEQGGGAVNYQRPESTHNSFSFFSGAFQQYS